MAYSRPRNAGVNVQQQQNAGNTPSLIGGTPKAKVGAAGKQFDFRDPNQILAAGNQRSDEINKFLNFFNKDVTPFVTEELDRRAKNEAAEVLDSFEGKDLLSDATPQASDAYRSISKRARDFVIEQTAIKSVNEFGPIYAAEINGGPDAALLARPSDDNPQLQAQQAQARSRALSVAQEKSGLVGIPAYTRMQYTPQLSASQGAVDNNTYTKQNAAQALSDEAEASGGYAVSFRRALDADLVQGTEILTQTLAEFQAEIPNQFTTVRAAEVLLQSLQKTFNNISDPNEQKEAARRLREQANVPLEINGVNLWELPIGNSGQTIKTYLDNQEDVFQAAQDKDDLAVLTQKMFLAESPEERRNIIQQYAGAGGSPDVILSLVQAQRSAIASNIETAKVNSFKAESQYLEILKRDGPEAANALLEQQSLEYVSNPNLYTTDYMNKVQAQRKAYAEKNYELLDPDGALFVEKTTQGMRVNGEYMNNLLNSLEDAIPYDLSSDQRQELNDQLQAKTYDILFDKWNELSPEEKKKFNFAAEIKESGQAAYAEIQDTLLANGADQELLAPERLVNAANNLESVISDSNGTLTLDMMPITVVNGLKRNGKNPEQMTERQLANALVNYLELFKEKNEKGEDIYVLTGSKDRTSLEKWLSSRLNKARNKTGQPQPNLFPTSDTNRFQSGREAGGLQAPANLDVKSLQNNYIQEIEEMRDNVQKQNRTRLDVVSSNLPPVLNALIGGPAKAAELENNTTEAVAALERAWNGFSPSSIKGPPMPQVAAATPTRTLPTLVTPNHEWMIAVGIAEGTRTASGAYTKNWSGHTDPGDKYTNVGTVSYSAARNGRYLSPAQVDEKYSRQFTNTALKMTPFLVRLGLKQGTAGFNRVMFNILDLEVQAPKAARDFILKLNTLKQSNFSIESIAKARADSFFNPSTGRLEASGFNNNYSRLLADQLSRARVFDYKKRI